MLGIDLEEKLSQACIGFENSSAENLIESGNNYLALLEEYSSKLHQHPGRYAQPADPSASEMVANQRKAIQAAIEQTERERNRVGELIYSFENMTAGEAAETLNRLNYQGLNSWKVRIAEVTDGGSKRMSLQEAVDTASLLLCEEYVAHRTISQRSCSTPT